MFGTDLESRFCRRHGSLPALLSTYDLLSGLPTPCPPDGNPTVPHNFWHAKRSALKASASDPDNLIGSTDRKEYPVVRPSARIATSRPAVHERAGRARHGC